MAPAVCIGRSPKYSKARPAAPCRVLLSPIDVRLPKADEADDAVDTVVQPDLLVVCAPSKIDAREYSRRT